MIRCTWNPLTRAALRPLSLYYQIGKFSSRAIAAQVLRVCVASLDSTLPIFTEMMSKDEKNDV
ncbi:hypothetical protein GI364_07095 [Alicyclobacillus sp. SO9]|nr:hypothetical protein GI364_07095 [Alicyclobacillus sp. SO9]